MCVCVCVCVQNAKRARSNQRTFQQPAHQDNSDERGLTQIIRMPPKRIKKIITAPFYLPSKQAFR